MLIVTLPEFAYAIHETQEVAAKHVLLIDLAEGLVIEKIGMQDPWPVVAKTVALAAAARAKFNPEGRSSDSMGDSSWSTAAARMGVYLTPEEISDLTTNPDGSGAGGPQGYFPQQWPYPDPVERQTVYVEL